MAKTGSFHKNKSDQTQKQHNNTNHTQQHCTRARRRFQHLYFHKPGFSEFLGLFYVYCSVLIFADVHVHFILSLHCAGQNVTGNKSQESKTQDICPTTSENWNFVFTKVCISRFFQKLFSLRLSYIDFVLCIYIYIYKVVISVTGSRSTFEFPSRVNLSGPSLYCT